MLLSLRIVTSLPPRGSASTLLLTPPPAPRLASAQAPIFSWQLVMQHSQADALEAVRAVGGGLLIAGASPPPPLPFGEAPSPPTPTFRS